MKRMMNRSWLRLSLGGVMFVLLFCASLSLVRPVLSALSEQIRKAEGEVALALQRRTGLSVSYGSLSPSVLSAINLRDVVVHDAATGREIARIKKVSVSYRLAELFSKKARKAVKSVTLAGAKIELDAETASRLRHVLFAPEDATSAAFSGGSPLFFEDGFRLPFDVFAKGFSLHYVDALNDVLVSDGHVALRNSARADGLSLESAGKFFFTNGRLSQNGKRLVFSCAFSALGAVLPGVDGSSVTVKLSENRAADFSISHFDVLLAYDDRTLSLKSLKSVVPVSVSAEAHLATGDCELSAAFKDMDPLSLVSVRKRTAVLEKLSGSRVSGALRAARADSRVSYALGISSSLGDALLGSPAELSLSCAGDARSVSVSELSVESAVVGASFSGSVDVRRLLPSGVLSVGHLSLKNGCTLSSELRLEPQDGGISVSSPGIFAVPPGAEDGIALSEFRLAAFPGKSSVDFSAEFDSRDGRGPPGHFRIDGSYLTGGRRFVQASVSVSDLFVERAFAAARVFFPGSAAQLSGAARAAGSLVFSGNVYVSSDFSDVTYSSMDCVLANVDDGEQMLLFAVDGSRQTLQVSQFDLRAMGQRVQATAGFDFLAGGRDFSFSADVLCNSVPYRFSGVRANGLLSVSGDYDFTFMAMKDRKTMAWSASMSFASLPVPAGRSVFALSTFSTFSGRTADDFSVMVNSLELEELSGVFASAPRVSLSGVATRSGFVADTIVYSDDVSALEGSGSVAVATALGVFESARCELSLRSAAGAEAVFLSAEFANDHHLPFSLGALRTKFALSGEAVANELSMARFLKKQNAADTVTGQVALSGTLENPFVTLSLDRASLTLGGKECTAQASVIYDEAGLNVYDLSATWGSVSVSGVSASIDPRTFSGRVDAEVGFTILGKRGTMPLSLALSGIPEAGRLSVPEFITVSIKSPGISGEFAPKPIPLDLIAMKVPNGFELFSRKSNAFRAAVSKAGNVSVQVARNETLSFELNGSVHGSAVDVSVTNLFGNLGKISRSVKIPFVEFASGEVSGALRVSGAGGDPDISGTISVRNSEFKVPKVSPSAIRAGRIDFTAEPGGISVQKTEFAIGKGIVDVSAQLELLGWGFGDMNVRFDTRAKKPVPIDMKFPLVGYKGYAGLALDMTFNVPDFIVYLKGDVYAERGDVDLVVSNFQSGITNIAFASFLTDRPGAAEKMLRRPDCVADIIIHAGQKFGLFFNPIMRAVISPKTEIALQVDSATGDVALMGDLELRGGEIMWLNRNFYLREGKIKCNETNSSVDPVVTVRAETKERDDLGNRVTLTLSAVNQHLSEFRPSFSASPAKSEAEIMELLGQAITGDASEVADVIASGGDFFVQTLVIRKVENALRDILNFDIFSIRTNVIQNALKISRTDKKDRQVSVGNYFDNTTVYIGKYFGSSIYADAMLSMAYDETKIGEEGSINGFVFQPEFGFEMESPFVNIRFGLAPDFEAMLNNSWLPSASMTLSWKHSF